MRANKPLRSESAPEVERLQRELRRVTTERDILKKALGYFARDPQRSTPLSFANVRPTRAMCWVMNVSAIGEGLGKASGKPGEAHSEGSER